MGLLFLSTPITRSRHSFVMSCLGLPSSSKVIVLAGELSALVSSFNRNLDALITNAKPNELNEACLRRVRDILQALFPPSHPPVSAMNIPFCVMNMCLSSV